MTNATEFELDAETVDRIADKYAAVWNEPDPERRRDTIAELWAADGEELVEGNRFRGHAELAARVERAHQEFVASGRFTTSRADDLAGHHDAITFTVQLVTPAGDTAWAARVFLLLDAKGQIRRDYHHTVIPLTQ